MEPKINIQKGPEWDKKRQFAIITYSRLHSKPSHLEEIHREVLNFASFEDLREMTIRVGVYNTQEARASIEKEDDSYTEKRIIQL
jgi:hypothetical protein